MTASSGPLPLKASKSDSGIRSGSTGARNRPRIPCQNVILGSVVRHHATHLSTVRRSSGQRIRSRSTSSRRLLTPPSAAAADDDHDRHVHPPPQEPHRHRRRSLAAPILAAAEALPDLVLRTQTLRKPSRLAAIRRSVQPTPAPAPAASGHRRRSVCRFPVVARTAPGTRRRSWYKSRLLPLLAQQRRQVPAALVNLDRDHRGDLVSFPRLP